MGWDGTYTDGKAQLTDVKAAILRPWAGSDNTLHEYTDSKVTNSGRNLWSVIRTNGTPVAIRLDLIRITKTEWLNKAMDESMGPSEEDCPLALLEICPDPGTSYSTAWRERVRAYHAAKANQRNLAKRVKAGDRVQLGKDTATLTSVTPTRILGLIDGRLYRIPRSQVTEILTQ